MRVCVCVCVTTYTMVYTQYGPLATLRKLSCLDGLLCMTVRREVERERAARRARRAVLPEVHSHGLTGLDDAAVHRGALLLID